MINLELPKRLEDTRALLRQFSAGGLRPLSRKYDLLEQMEMPQELYDLGKLLGGGRNRAAGQRKAAQAFRNGNNMFIVLSSRNCAGATSACYWHCRMSAWVTPP
jgi:hypothetical protein